MKLIYLDQNVWVALLRGHHSADPYAERLVQRLVSLREAGLAAIPLSASHYLETWHRRDPQSRHALAGLMRDVTGYFALAPVDSMEREWVERTVRRLCQMPVAPTPPLADLLGYGVNHAFGTQTGRLRVVSSIATDEDPEGHSAEVPPELVHLAEAGGDHWEWFNLAGPEEFLDSYGVDVRPEHRLGTADADYESQLRLRLRSDAYARQRLSDLILTQEFTRILDFINDACAELGVDPHGLFLKDDPQRTIRSFVDAVPVTNVIFMLRLHRHRDFNFPIEQHDRTDMCVLALAVPHCAVVATERRWIHVIRQADLDRRYGTVLCGSLAELDRALDQLIDATIDHE